MISSLWLLLLLSLSFTKANDHDCDIFSKSFQNEGIGGQYRCIQVHEAVRKAFWSNKINNYTLEAFNTSYLTTVTVIYKVQIIDTSAASHGSASDGNNTITCEGKNSCSISMGWSSANFYTFIRPEFVLSLQPAWFLSSLKFSLHEHYKGIIFYIDLQKEEATWMTTLELKQSLKQITGKVIISILVQYCSSVYYFKIIFLLCRLQPIKSTWSMSGIQYPRLERPLRSSMLRP